MNTWISIFDINSIEDWLDYLSTYNKVFWESISINQDDPTYLSTLPTSFIEQALRLGTAYLNLNNAVLNGPSNFDQISNNLKYLSVSADRKVMSKNLNEFQTFITFNPKHLLLSTDSLEKLSLDLLTTQIVDGILKSSKTLKVLKLSQGYKVKFGLLGVESLLQFCTWLLP